jgi:RNA polymerase sigma factor (sigma-70 family)
MSSAQVSAVLGHIRKLASAQEDHERPDDELLQRFAAHQDEAAFAALLRRHGPMVLSVCRSVLHHVQDAEDAFQAAFLLLAQKAGSIHRREAVSGWLYRVAYHLAVRAQANAARRRVHERRAVAMPSADPVLDMSLREVRGVLFAELENLPEQYRAPLVLCALEEKSREEAARLLGWSPNAVKGKLERGRELLRARLRRRGLELPAGLCAGALALNAESGLSAPLADATLRAAVKVAAGGSMGAARVSEQVAALVQGASKTLFTSKVRLATVLFLALGVAAASLGVLLHQVSAAGEQALQGNQAASPQAERRPPEQPREPAAEARIEVHGQVLGPDGKPAVGAKLYLARTTSEGQAHSEQGASGKDGRFQFTIPASTLEKTARGAAGPQVMAVAPGYGCDWATVRQGSELTLRLVKDEPIRGRILDPDGKPVAGARLTVRSVHAARGEDLGEYVAAAREGHGIEFAKSCYGTLPGSPAVLITAADGRFRLPGVGRERVVHFRIEGPVIASAYLEVMTRPVEMISHPRHGNVYGASFDYVGLATRPLRGVVRDKDTGRPLAGVAVGHYSWEVKTVTDPEGHYELRGLVKSGRYALAVRPGNGLYFCRRVQFQDTPGLDALQADIELVQGLMIRGRVTDLATGKPIAQARVDYHPLGGNSFVNSKVAGSWSPRSETTTGPDGSYILTVMPGPGVLGVTAPQQGRYMPAHLTLQDRKDFFKTPLVDDRDEDYLTRAAGANSYGSISQQIYNALVLLELGEKDQALVKDVALEAARERKGRVVGPEDQPITGVAVLGLIPWNATFYDFETLKGAEFVVQRINPRANRPLVFYHKDRNLGCYVKELRGDSSEPLLVKLQPCGSASGRVLDPDGQPVAGLRLWVNGRAHHWGGDGRASVTDKDGRFRVEGLVPGEEYRVMEAAHSSILRLFAPVVVAPGKHQDLGDLKMDPPR